MINLTEKELDSIPKISETEYLNETPIHIKFFLPGTDWRWYVTEAQKESDGEVVFFGFVHTSPPSRISFISAARARDNLVLAFWDLMPSTFAMRLSSRR